MHFIDSHAHINSEHFKDNWQQIISEANKSGVSIIINNASDLANTEWGIEQSRQVEGLYTTAGIHPEYFLESDQEVANQDINNLRRLISKSAKVVAIGEIGLDYTLDPSKATKQKQHELLFKQLQLATQLRLPVTLHVRDQPGHTDCFNDLIAMLEQFKTSNQGVSSTSQLASRSSSDASQLTGVFHCWVGNPDQAKKAIALGFYLSFSGILTYKSAGHILDVAAQVPLNRVLIETDSPFLTPEPARSQMKPQYNQPKYVIMTAEKLASIKNISLEEVAQITTTNARDLFRLNSPSI